jgi:hypothetical protein
MNTIKTDKWNACKEEKGLMIPIGTLITANQIGTKLDARQGIFLGGNVKLFKIQGESGIVYDCEGKPIIVPDEHLWGSTEVFVMEWRKQNLER